MPAMQVQTEEPHCSLQKFLGYTTQELHIHIYPYVVYTCICCTYILYKEKLHRSIDPITFRGLRLTLPFCPLSELHRSHANKDWNSLRNMEFESQTRGCLQRSWDDFISTPVFLK